MNMQSNHILCTTLLALAAGACIQAHVVSGAKNVVFFLGGGMGPTTVTVTRIYKVNEAGHLTTESFKRTARIKMCSNDARTTDSASPMSAYMTGMKMNNEATSVSTDAKASDATGKGYVSSVNNTCPANNGTPAVTLLELAKAVGKSVDVVTATRVTHIMSAATYSHVCHRDGENQIAT